jgi:hypothetical protein
MDRIESFPGKKLIYRAQLRSLFGVPVRHFFRMNPPAQPGQTVNDRVKKDGRIDR